MTWVKLDDAFAEHPKVVGLSDAAFRLLVASMCYCGRWSTDGVIPKGALKIKPALARELVSRGNWHASGHECATCPAIAPGAFYVHEFLVHNPSAEEVELARGRRKEKASKAARARWDKAPSNARSIAASMQEAMPPDAPVPYPVTPNSHPSHSEPGCGKPSDDDTARIEEQPLDPVDVTAAAVLYRVAESKMRGIADIRSDDRYRTRVLAELEEKDGHRLRSLIRDHPGAPIESFAGELLGEQNSLHRYRRPA